VKQSIASQRELTCCPGQGESETETHLRRAAAAKCSAITRVAAGKHNHNRPVQSGQRLRARALQLCVGGPRPAWVRLGLDGVAVWLAAASYDCMAIIGWLAGATAGANAGAITAAVPCG
jgi:hypothetical protein